MKRAWLLNDLYVNEKARGMGTASKLLDAAKGFRCRNKFKVADTANSGR
jgi:hypothetical protein